MPYAAITYRVKPGHEDEIAAIFAEFQRVDTPDFAHADGAAAGRLLGTGVFIKDESLVRVIHYEGDFAAVGRHMAAQRGVAPAGGAAGALPRRAAGHHQRGGLRGVLPQRRDALDLPAHRGHPPDPALSARRLKGGSL